MSDYTKATDFATKDTLLPGDSNKIVRGSEIDTEFSNIQTAVNSKANIASPTFTGTPAAPTAAAGTNTTQIATTAFVTTAISSGIGTVTSDITMNGATFKFSKGADVASATALPLLTDGNYFEVTGITPITSFDSMGVGTIIGLHFVAAPLLVYNATDLILPGGDDIQAAAGDEAIFVEYDTGMWRCLAYTKASGLGVVEHITELGTSAANTGTSVTVSNIPAWVNRVNVSLDSVSTNGSNLIIVQAIVGGSPVTSGYVGIGAQYTSVASSTASITTGFGFQATSVAASNYTMLGSLLRITGNTWKWVAQGHHSGLNTMFSGSGSIDLAGALEGVRLTSVGTSDTFDGSGTISVSYE